MRHSFILRPHRLAMLHIRENSRRKQVTEYSRAYIYTGPRYRYSRIYISPQIRLGYYVNCRYSWGEEVLVFFCFSSTRYSTIVRWERCHVDDSARSDTSPHSLGPRKELLTIMREAERERERQTWNKGNALCCARNRTNNK